MYLVYTHFMSSTKLVVPFWGKFTEVVLADIFIENPSFCPGHAWDSQKIIWSDQVWLCYYGVIKMARFGVAKFHVVGGTNGRLPQSRGAVQIK